MNCNFRIGHGYDVHRLTDNRQLWLGGIQIPHTQGLAGHSDADVLLHAVSDALLGAAALGDIGQHFPDTDASIEGIDSKLILGHVVDLLRQKGYEIGNIDATIIAQRPKMAPHLPCIVATMARVMGVDTSQISVKATTTERLGFTGREEGIAAEAVALIVRRDQQP